MVEHAERKRGADRQFSALGASWGRADVIRYCAYACKAGAPERDSEFLILSSDSELESGFRLRSSDARAPY